MTKKIIPRIVLWCCVATIMITIFIFSSQPASVSSKTSSGVIERFASVFIRDYENMPTESKATFVSGMQHFARKTAHFSIYCILGIFATFSMLTYIMQHWRRILIAAAICLAYAASDEFHQIFVAGRSCEFADVLLDFCGSLLGIAIVSLGFYLNLKRKRKTKAGTN